MKLVYSRGTYSPSEHHHRESGGSVPATNSPKLPKDLHSVKRFQAARKNGGHRSCEAHLQGNAQKRFQVAIFWLVEWLPSLISLGPGRLELTINKYAERLTRSGHSDQLLDIGRTFEWFSLPKQVRRVEEGDYISLVELLLTVELGIQAPRCCRNFGFLFGFILFPTVGWHSLRGIKAVMRSCLLTSAYANMDQVRLAVFLISIYVYVD